MHRGLRGPARGSDRMESIVVLTKDELIAALQKEVRILLHLVDKIDRAQLDYRPTSKQRSTLELLRYLSVMGPGLIQASLTGFNPEVWGKAMAEANARDFDQTRAALAAHAGEYDRLVGGMSDADFRGTTMDFGQILNNTLSQILSPTTFGFALAAIGLSIHFGFAGLLNMGVAGFMAVGAYGFAISILTFGLPWWLAALVGFVIAAVFALGGQDDLGDLLARQADAFKRLRKGRPWDTMKADRGFKGLIRSLEVTHGANGWHPHTHELWFLKGSSEGLQSLLAGLWVKACAKAGLIAVNDEKLVEAFMEHGVDVKVDVDCGDYLAKQDDSRRWGFAEELSKATSKAGRAKGVHPHHFLVRKAPGDRERYIEYVQAMKGRRQLFWSNGLKSQVGIDEVSDEVLADEIRHDCIRSC